MSTTIVSQTSKQRFIDKRQWGKLLLLWEKSEHLRLSMAQDAQKQKAG